MEIEEVAKEIPKDPAKWSSEDVSHWLQLINMPEYINTFSKNLKPMNINNHFHLIEDGPVDGLNLFKLDEAILAKELGVIKGLHRARILEGNSNLYIFKITKFETRHFKIKENDSFIQ